MKVLLLLITLTLSMIQYAWSATVVFSSYNISTTVAGGTSQAASDNTTPILGTTILTNDGTNNTSATATAANFNFATTSNPNDFSLSIAQGIVSAQRTQNSGGPVDASAMLTYQVDFTIAAGELGVVTLDFDYLFTETGGNDGSLTWSLTGPGGPITAIAGSVIDPIALTNSSQTATDLAEGSYSLVLVAELPTQPFNNNQDAVTIDVSNIQLNFSSSIPEPSTSLLLGLAGFFLLKRKRS